MRERKSEGEREGERKVESQGSNEPLAGQENMPWPVDGIINC